MGKTIVRKNKVGEPILHAFKAYKTTIIKTMVLHREQNKVQNRPIHTWPVNFCQGNSMEKELCFKKYY